jgi:hypothetical protein
MAYGMTGRSVAEPGYRRLNTVWPARGRKALLLEKRSKNFCYLARARQIKHAP